jgi:SOS-response transcriptional repressor LexA
LSIEIIQNVEKYYMRVILGDIDIQIGDRLKRVRVLLGFAKQVLFSAELGLENQTYGRYEKGERSLPDEIKLKLFEMGVNISWLITGQGEPLIEKQHKKAPLIEELQKIIEQTVGPKLESVGKIEARLSALEQRIDRPSPSGSGYTAEPEPEYEAEPEPGTEAEPDGEAEPEVPVPYVEDIAAGPPIAQSEDQSQLIAVPAWYIRKGFRHYAARIRGTSMTEAGIRDGDQVLIRYVDTPIDGAIQVVRYQGRSTLKRVRETEGGGWEMHYEDGSGKVVALNSREYEVQGEFVTVLPRMKAPGVRKKGSI